MSSELAKELSKQTGELLSRFEARASSFSRRPDLAKLAVPDDVKGAEEFAKKFFGEGEHLATGIDGSMDFDERLQMMLFYANATAYSCAFTVGDHIEFDLGSAHRESRLAASAAVPLWAEDLSSVFSKEPEIDIELEHSMERIPNSFMTLGELYLAYIACEKAKVVFLDRPMSGTFSTLSRDARNLMRGDESKLSRWGLPRVSKLDLHLAVYLGSPSMSIPTRRGFTGLAAIKVLIEGPLTFQRLAERIGVGEAATRRAVKRVLSLDKQFHGALLSDSSEDHLSLRDGVAGYWERVSRLSLDYAQDVFGRKRHPLALNSEEYLTILDVNAVSLFLLEAACERARKTGALLVGIAKDTTATDISRAVLPYAESEGFLKLTSSPPRLKNDRAFLAILSSENPSILTPWRTVGYDSAFSTIVDIGEKLVSARKVVSREKLFSRSYFQLRTLRNDSGVRSQVFLFDRVFDERYDSEAVRKVKVEERAGETRVDAYFEGSNGSELSNLVLHILSMNDNPEVFEAFGHNQLLFLADKAVKAEVRLSSSSLRGVADLRVGGLSSRKKIFGLVTPYRQQRAEAEHARTRR